MNPGVPKVRWLRLIAATVLVTILVPMGIEHFRIRAQFQDAAGTLPDRVEEAKRAGIPLEWDQLDANVPPEQNAASLYVRASAKYAKLPDRIDQDLFPPQGDAAAAKRRDALAECADVLAVLKAASQKPRCFFEHDWSHIWSKGPAWPSELGALARLVGAQAEWEARGGRLESAIGWLQVGATMSRHMGEEPTMSGWMTQNRMETIVTASMQRIVRPDRVTRNLLDPLAQVVRTMDASPELALRGEFLARYRIYDELDALFEEMPRGDAWEEFADAYSWNQNPYTFNRRAFRPTLQDQNLVQRAYQARVLGRWIPFLEAVQNANGDVERIGTAIDTLGEAIALGDHRMDRAEDQLGGLSYQLAIALKQTETRHRMARQMLEVLAFRVRMGRLPDTLAEAGKPLIDPYDGKPLRYKPERSAFSLYSVGQNAADDGGVPGNGYGGDIVFSIPKAP